MLGLFQNMVFLHPIILSALLALPLLWYLLRVTPPPPKRVLFPATRFLEGLVPKENVPSKTPWWILLLRLLMAALLVIALAHPIINPAKGLTESGTIRIVMDNSWAGAQSWHLQKAAAEELLSQASREGREIYIMTTAPAIGENKPEHFGVLAYSDALAILRGLSPQPWPSDYAGCLKLLSELKSSSPIHTIWLSHGLDEGNALSLARALQNQGSLTYITPKPENMPLLLRPADRTKIPVEKEPKVYIGVDAPENIPESLPVSMQAQGKNGIILDIQNKNITPKRIPEAVGFDIVENLRNDITQFRINGRNGAGSVFLLDDQYKKRNVGIVASAETSESAPLIEAGYYLKRALEPHANLKIGTIEDLLKEDINMIVLPDVAAMPSETLDTLEKWIKSGGLLLRFSGQNMSEHQGEQYLLPVRLRSGGRSLSGSMSWAEPQEIAPFKDTSPFYGLDIPSKITIKQQVLADPAQDMEGKIWAELNDGTPLITGMPLEQGMIVLIHTTATPEWSDLALSGLFVDILQRLVSMAGGSSSEMTQNHTMLDPVSILDGSGALIPPPSSVRPLPSADARKIVPNSMNPPGIYGRGGFQYALNIGTALPPLKSLSDLPVSVTKSYYEADYEIDLMPYLLYATLLLFIIDWMIMVFVVSGSLSKIFVRTALPFLIFATFSHTSFAASMEEDIRYSEGLYLAYIKTGNASLDGTFQSGLEALQQQLTRRTSVEPVGVVGLDPENDTLIFFPIIYWGVSAEQKNISDKAIQNIQFYLDHGGTILFDTRDQGNASIGQVSNSENAIALRRLTSSLNIPPIVPIPHDHVLGRSFYLLDKFPGRYADGTLWLEQHSMDGRDGVSSVIIGSNDWASAWAGNNAGSVAGRGQARQQEMSMRFGINLVMYALTGNYKADQVHIPHILRRLGK